MAEAASASTKMKKELGLFAVYAVSTAGLLSSGVFILPGLLTFYAGSAAPLAFVLAGLLMVPALLAMAELSTALPRSGGPYYFLDRALGPMVGTVGGIGTYLALVLKTCFAFIGLAGYLAILFAIGDDAMAPYRELVAIGLTVLFASLNILGAKETTRLQNILMVSIAAVLAYFIVEGLVDVTTKVGFDAARERFDPLLNPKRSYHGVVYATGLVFVSFAGLVKLASVSEEVANPERNLPRGMILSLLTATVVNAVACFIMVAELRDHTAVNAAGEQVAWMQSKDITPAATAIGVFLHWLPGRIEMVIIALAAMAAFAASGNAGILGASRYPLAMSRDRLLPRPLGSISRFGTPLVSIVLTAVVMTLFILTLDVGGVAKLAGVFNLFVFALLNLAVIVMRESRIESYDPGFKAPLYPWMQLLGIAISLWLIVEMGRISILFTAAVAAVGVVWYFLYAQDKAKRQGAIYHWFERLGHHRYEALDSELREIMKEKGVRARDPFNDVIFRARVIDLDETMRFEDLAEDVAVILARRVPGTVEEIAEEFRQGTRLGVTPVTHGAALPHIRRDGLDHPELVVVRSRPGVEIVRDRAGREADADAEAGKAAAEGREEPEGRPPKRQVVHALFFLCSPESDPGQHLRMLAEIASRVDEDTFLAYWNTASSPQELKEILLRDERFLGICVERGGPTEPMIGKAIAQLELPHGCLIALVRRDHEEHVPTGATVLENGDRLTIIGEPRGIRTLQQRYQASVERGGVPDLTRDEEQGEG